MRNKRGFALPAPILIGVVGFIIFLIVIVAVAGGGDTGDISEGANCESFATYEVDEFTHYAGDCDECGGTLGTPSAFKDNEYKIPIDKINVVHDNTGYAPKDPVLSKIFREVSQDPLLKPENTEPTYIEYKDPDFGWVKIVARVTESKIFQKPGTIVNVIPGNGPQFKAIVADTGMGSGGCANPETCANLDLLMTTQDKGLNYNAVIPGLKLKGSIEILRYGPDGEINCSEGGSTGDTSARSGVCYRGSKALDYSVNSWDLSSSERSCLANNKLTIDTPKTPNAILAAGQWLLTKPKVPYSQACRNPGGTGWREGFGSNCNRTGPDGKFYPYAGLDCSSFVSWAHRTAGYDGIALTSSGFYGSGRFTTVSSPQAGDILVTNGHVILIGKVYSKDTVDLIETGTWYANSPAAKSVHIHVRTKLTYSGSKVLKAGDKRKYIIRRVKSN